jgi:hypothetical protein
MSAQSGGPGTRPGPPPSDYGVVCAAAKYTRCEPLGTE